MHLLNYLCHSRRTLVGACLAASHPVACFTANEIAQVVADERASGGDNNYKWYPQVSEPSTHATNDDQCLTGNNREHRIEHSNRKNNQVEPGRR